MTAQAPAANPAPTTTHPATPAPTVADIAAHTDVYNAHRFEPLDFEAAQRLAAMFYDAGTLPQDCYPPKKTRDSSGKMQWVRDYDAAIKQGRARGIGRAVMRIMAGARLGMGAIDALANIDIIGQRAAPRARALAAVCIQSRACESWRVEESTAERCTIVVKRRGEEPLSVTVELSEFEHLVAAADKEWERTKGWDSPALPPWKFYRRHMLIARCESLTANMHFPELTSGFLAAEVLRDVPRMQIDSRPGVPIDDQTAAILAMGDKAEEAPAEPPPAAEPRAMELPLPTPAARPTEPPAVAPITQAEREQLGAIIADKSKGVVKRLHAAQYKTAIWALDVPAERQAAMVAEVERMIAGAK